MRSLDLLRAQPAPHRHTVSFGYKNYVQLVPCISGIRALTGDTSGGFPLACQVEALIGYTKW